MKDYYNRLIEEEYNKLNNSSKASAKMNHYNTIIKIKKSLYLGNKYEENIYQDIKCFLKYYICALDERSFEYDLFSKNIIKNIFMDISDDKKLVLYYYLMRQLKIKSFSNDEIIWCESQIKRIELIKFSCNFNFIKIFFLLTSYNVYSLILFLFIIMCFINILFLPETYIGVQLFTITYENYYDDFILNHILNVSNYLLNFSNGSFKVVTNSILGFLTLLTIKIIFYIVIINYIVKEIFRKVSKYE